MDIITSTQQEGVALTTTPVKIWSTNSSRVGIQVKAPSTNASNICVRIVPAGSSAPGTVTPADAHIEVAPGGYFEGDNRYNKSWDVYAAMDSGSGVGNFYEVQN